MREQKTEKQLQFPHKIWKFENILQFKEEKEGENKQTQLKLKFENSNIENKNHCCKLPNKKQQTSWMS